MYLKPKELFEKALALAGKGDKQSLDEAEKMAATLLQHKPDDASTLALTGQIMAVRQYYGIARQLLYRAIQVLPDDPKYDMNRAEYHNNIGFCCRYLDLYQEGRECFHKALQLAGPGKFQDIYGNLASLYVGRGEAAEGLTYADKALSYNRDDLSATNNKSIMLLELGRLEEGFNLYDARMCIKEERGEAMWKEYPGDIPLWDGTPGKKVAVYGEQGLGDEIMFASMLPDIAKDCNIVFDCHDRLYNIFKDSFDFPIYGTKRQDPKTLPWWDKHKIEYKLPVGSLAKFYRKRVEDFPKTPYLKPIHLPEVSERIAALGPRPKIGFSWMGGRIDTHCWQRHIPLWLWKDIFALDADFISLQYDAEAGAVIDDYCSKNNVTLHHWADILTNQDYSNTAALVSQLDIVVSVPQSVVHLAGGLGVPTIQLTPKHAMWQMGVYGHDMPWYGCVKSYWQATADDWVPVLQQAETDLSCLMELANDRAAIQRTA